MDRVKVAIWYTPDCGHTHLSEDGAVYLTCPDGVLAPDSLDAAWAEAEAALPEGWAIVEISRIGGGLHGELTPTWCALAVPSDSEWISEQGDAAYGPTPAAALRVLAAKLRESTRTT